MKICNSEWVINARKINASGHTHPFFFLTCNFSEGRQMKTMKTITTNRKDDNG